MAPTSTDPKQRDERLEQVLAEYVRSLETGQPLDRGKLLAEHPDLADELRSFFRNRSAVEHLAAPLVAAAELPTLGLDSPPGDPRAVRYFGDYELLDEIARGGMGVVFKARQKSLNRLVALKMIIAGQLASDADVQRFQQEAEAAANLDHSGIVPIYEVGEHDGQHYFSMKLINGGSLRERIGEFRLDHRDAAALIAAAARAVHHAHQRGVLHRDLKPGNILIDAGGQPHVTDFGLAKRVEGASDLTQSGAIVGTPAYMAPEQTQAKKPLTTAADVYSLGAMLYELMTGDPPFRGDSPAETLIKVLSHEPTAPRSVNSAIDRDLETICLKCLEKDPQRRYDSAAALANDLDRWLRGEPILARPSTRWEQAAKWARRKPAAAALLAVSALAVLAIIIVQAFNNTQIRREQELALNAANAAIKSNHEAQTAERLAERRLYGAQVLLAHATLEQTQIGQARRALDNTPPELRGWEWNYLDSVCDTSRQTIKAPDSLVALAFSPDGAALGTLGGFEGAHWLDLNNPGKPRSQRAESGYGITLPSPVPNAAFSPNLHRCLIYTAAGLDLWDTQANKREPLGPRRPKAANPAFTAVMGAVALSPDGKLGYCAADKRVACWDLETKQEVWQIPLADDECWAIAISPDQKQVAVSCDDHTAQVLDVDTKKEIFRTEKHLNKPDLLAFTPDGKRLISQSAFQNPRLWDVTANNQLLKLSLGPSHDSSLSADRRLGASGMGTGEVVLWSTETGKELRVLRGTTAFINCTAFSPDAKLVAFGGRDKVVQLWDVKTGTLVRKLVGHSDAILALAFTIDGKTLASSDGRQIKLWEIEAPNNPLKLPLRGGETRAWQFLPGGKRLVTCGWYLRDNERPGLADLWDLDTGKIFRTFGPQGHWLEALSLSADGTLLASASDEGTVTLWNVADGSRIRVFGQPPNKAEQEKLGRWGMRSVVLRPDGKQVAAGDHEGHVTVWSVADGSTVWKADRMTPADWHILDSGKDEPAPMEIRDLEYSRDGKQLLGLASYGDRLVQIWDADTGHVQFTSGRLQREAPMVISGDGRWLAYGAEWVPGAVHLRELATGRETVGFGKHARITTLALSHDGHWLALGSPQNDQIELYDTQTGHLATTFAGHESVVGTLAFLPDSSRLVSGGWDHTVKMWDPKSGQELLSLPMGPNPDERVEHILISPDGSRIVATDGFPEAGAGRRETMFVWKSRPKSTTAGAKQ